jgi:hypothetical protein
MPFNMIPVKSSQISAIGFDPETKTLRVRFNDRTNKKTGAVTPGSVYEYTACPAEHYAGLLAAHAADGESVGAYFGQHIRNGGYVFRKIEE